VKLRHIAALALVGWYLMAPSDIHAQSQLQAPTPPAAAAAPSNNTLEIPVVVRPNQPPLSPTFAGVWCGYERFKFYKSEPVGPEPRRARRGSSRCYAFKRSGNGIALIGGLLGSPDQRFVSQSAKAVNAREIIVTTISEMTVPPLRATAGMILDFKLDTDGSTVNFTRTLRIVETDMDLTHATTVTSQYGGTKHRGTPSETKAYDALMSGQRYLGGGDVAVPGAR
jgi:hypothetical protein